MKKALKSIPAHLKRYLVEQTYERYTSEDHAVWRFIMRELTTFHFKNAHKSYRKGVKGTGITLDRIPSLKNIDKCLQKYGWRAAGVSGFIPPAAFMELQAHRILPIATEMRRVENLEYTPAPDIVHEAAGHAPMLADAQFSRYLRRYAEVASKAIITKKDLDQYEAIRELSDLKEHPDATQEHINRAYAKLELANEAIKDATEASMLARMGWWTTEYGLMGKGDHPRIYGAGLLSSVGESRQFLSPKVKKIPFSVDCVDQSYDITDPQPQLFVARDFKDLDKGLDDLAERMAFKRGGAFGLERMLSAETVNTIELASGLQISGVLASYKLHGKDVSYVQLKGPTQLSFDGKQLSGHGTKYHAGGYGTPIGFLKGEKKGLGFMTLKELKARGIELKKDVRLEFTSGVVVAGHLSKKLSMGKKLLVLTFKKCTVTLAGEILFRPEWGNFDLGVGASVVSVFGGPADRPAYGETYDFVATKLHPRIFSSEEKELFALYAATASLRKTGKYDESDLLELLQSVDGRFKEAWLLRFEILELALLKKINSSWMVPLADQIKEIASKWPKLLPYVVNSLDLIGYEPQFQLKRGTPSGVMTAFRSTT